MLDIGGLDEGFPVKGEMPKRFDPHTMRNSINTSIGIQHQISKTWQLFP